MDRMEDRLRALQNSYGTLDLTEWNKIHSEGEKVIPQLCEILSHSDPILVQFAAGLLGAQSKAASEAVPQLADLTRHENSNIRSAAASALGLIGARPRVSVPALARAVGDNDTYVKRRAAVALGAFSQRDLIKYGALLALDRATSDLDLYVREAAIDTLGPRRPTAMIAPSQFAPKLASATIGSSWMMSATF